MNGFASGQDRVIGLDLPFPREATQILRDYMKPTYTRHWKSGNKGLRIPTFEKQMRCVYNCPSFLP